MNVGIVCFPGYGGSGVVAAELGKALASHGHEVHFITRGIPFRVEELSERLQFHQVDPMPYPVFEAAPYTLALATRIAEVAERHALDIVHAHYAIPHSTAAYLARVSSNRDFRVITTLHGTDTRLVGLDSSYRHIVKFSIEQSHGVTAVSEYLREASVKDFDLQCPVEVIPNFVDTTHFRPGICPRLRAMLAPGHEPLVVNVSNLRPVKGVLDVIRAHAIITRETGARLIVVGNGPEREAAETLAGELDIASRVTFVGQRDDVAPYLAAADVYLQAAKEESFGVAALEAQSAGLPAVAMRVGGLAESIADGATGMLTPCGCVAALADAVVGLLQDSDRRRDMGGAARRRAVEQFDTKVVLPQYEAYYAASRSQ